MQLFFKVFSVAIISLLQVSLVQNSHAGTRTPQVQYPLAQLAQAGEIVMQLTGDDYRYIDSARVVNNERTSRVRRDVQAKLGPWRNGGRQLMVQADQSATTGAFNRIEGLQAGRPSVIVPMQMEVVSRTQDSSWFLQRPQSRPVQFANRNQYPYMADLYHFSKPITKVTAAYPDLRLAGAVEDDRWIGCQLTGDNVEVCAAMISSPESVHTQTAEYASPVLGFHPQSPAIIGGVLEISISAALEGEDVEVKLGNDTLELVPSSPGKIIAYLPNTPTAGKLMLIRSDESVNTLAEHYAVVDPIVLPFDAFDADAESYSLTNAYLLSIVSKYVYRNLDEPFNSDEYCNNQPNVFEDWGLNVLKCLDENGNGWLTDTQALVLENDDALIIGFAGTQLNPHDLLTDLISAPVDWPEPAWAHGLHLGFYQAHNPIIDRRPMFETIVDYANNAHISGKKIWLTGHSLGGALAQITAYRLERAHKNIDVQGVVTFGAPMIGTSEFTNKFDSRFQEQAQRWVNYDDPVPTLPGGQYRQTGTLVNIKQTGQIVYDASSDMDLSFNPVLNTARFFESLSAEHMNYFGILHNTFIQTEFARTFVYDFAGVNGENDELWNIWPVPE